MPLVIPTGEGTGFIRFKPTENAWFMSGPDGIQEFEWKTAVVVDVENAQLGYLLLAPGIRDWIEWPDNDRTKAEKPEGEYKTAVKVQFFSPKTFGDDDPVRELCTSTVGVVTFIQDLYAAAETKFKEGVPVVDIDGSTPLKIGKGSTRVPQFTIKKFIDRPDELVFSNGHDVGESDQPKATEPDDDDEF